MGLALRLAAAFVMLAGVVLAAPPQMSRALPSDAQVLIENVTPAVPHRADTLTVSGRVANTSDDTLFQPQVQLRLSPLPLVSREEIRQVLDGTSARGGNAVPGTLVELPAELLPGQQAQFRVSVPISELPLSDGAGVYAVFVELLTGGVSATSSGTVFPWFPGSAEFTPSRLALLWPVTQRPAVAAHDLVTSPEVPAEFSAAGRLDRLLRVGAEHRVSWLVDSATAQVADSMSDGYDVLTGAGPEPGDGTQAAGGVADRLRDVLTDDPAAVMPQFALNDDDALTDGGAGAGVVRSATLPLVIRDDTAPESDTPTVYVAPGGSSAEDTLRTVVDAGIRTLVMSDTAFPPVEPLPYTPSGGTSLDVAGTSVRVALTDNRLGRYLAGPFTTAADRSRAMQAVLADTAMITLERPAEPRSVAALPPLLWAPPAPWLNRVMNALDRASWIELTDLERVAAAPDQVARVYQGQSQTARLRQLPQPYIQRIIELQSQLDALARIVNDPDGFGETFALALQRAASALWRGQRRERTVLLDTIAAQLTTERERVHVVSSGTVTLAGDSGIVPLTIANDLDRSVTVGVELRSDEGLGLEYTPPEPVRIDAQAKAGLEVPVRVVGSRPIQVNVVLTDRSGQEFDSSASFELRSTAATRIAGIIVGVGGVTLAIMVVLNLWRRRSAAGQGDS